MEKKIKENKKKQHLDHFSECQCQHVLLHVTFWLRMVVAFCCCAQLRGPECYRLDFVSHQMYLERMLSTLNVCQKGMLYRIRGS